VYLYIQYTIYIFTGAVYNAENIKMFGKKLSGIFPRGIFSIRLCHSQFLQNKFNIQGTVNREEGQISMPVYM